MSELRYRHPDEATAPKPDRPHQQDAPGQRDRPVTEGRSSRDNISGYDADAEFKRPVPKPGGYLPDDTGGTAPTDAELRDHRSWVKDHPGSADLTPGRDPTEAPRLREAAEGDQTDALKAVVDRPDFRDPTDRRSPDRYGDPLTRPDGTRIPCLDGPPRREETRQGWA